MLFERNILFYTVLLDSAHKVLRNTKTVSMIVFMFMKNPIMKITLKIELHYVEKFKMLSRLSRKIIQCMYNLFPTSKIIAQDLRAKYHLFMVNIRKYHRSFLKIIFLVINIFLKEKIYQNSQLIVCILIKINTN